MRRRGIPQRRVRCSAIINACGAGAYPSAELPGQAPALSADACDHMMCFTHVLFYTLQCYAVHLVKTHWNMCQACRLVLECIISFLISYIAPPGYTPARTHTKSHIAKSKRVHIHFLYKAYEAWLIKHMIFLSWCCPRNQCQYCRRAVLASACAFSAARSPADPNKSTCTQC